MPKIDDAIEQIRAGNREKGRQMLEQLLEEDENNEEVWLWLSSVVDSDEDREICLENVLALNPDNEVAQKGLELLQSGTFNINELLGGDFEEEVPESDEQVTFIDDFIIAEGEEEGLELQDGKAEGKKKINLNVKVVVLVVLAILVIVVFIGLGAAYFFLLAGGDDSMPVDTPAGQETPGEAPGPAVDPTETPSPVPTEEPTATFTPALQLPTAAPTITPSPTATTVVSPTPTRQ